jgi:hypothetical protein
MSLHGLQTLIWQAVVDEDFRAGVLNGRRADLIQGIDLDDDEARRVLAIRTDTLPDFANVVFEIMQSRYSRPAPHWLERSSKTESTYSVSNL